MKFAAFDLEIAKDFPESGRWQDAAPLGITCAAIACRSKPETMFFKGVPQMSQDECQALVRELQSLANDGYTLLTWNGCGFDFAVLAQESGLHRECAELALQHVDLMLMVTFTKGWFLGLEKALQGAGLAGKRKTVKLKNGGMFEGMDGGKAPRLWAEGEYDAVLTYLNDDVVQLLKLAEVVQLEKTIRWTSSSRKPMSMSVPKFLNVMACFDIAEPDVSWMSAPPTRRQFVEWMFQGSNPISVDEKAAGAENFLRMKQVKDAGSQPAATR